MNQTSDVGNSPRDSASVDCLGDLRLSEADYAALARQGSVSCEYRGSRAPFYKLRFRVGGRQQVRCIGTDAGRARQIASAVAELQAPHNQQRELTRLVRRARKYLRETKTALVDVAGAAGLRFHGYALRRTKQKV